MYSIHFNPLKLTAMKNKMYIVGLVSVMLIGLGGTFKINHFPGASILLTLGIVALSFVFFPVAFISAYRQNKSKNGFIYLTAALMAIILFTGALIKIMHWPGASIFVNCCNIVPGGGFFTCFLLCILPDKKRNRIKTLCTSCF
jgi:glucose-6-phosphate-specific signal transduction histidine kinase